MTEQNPHYVPFEEANKMKCPMKLAATIRYSKCHGPECMAWRWQEIFEDLTQYKDGKITLLVAILQATAQHTAIVEWWGHDGKYH
jgi:hypothetical protein